MGRMGKRRGEGWGGTGRGGEEGRKRKRREGGGRGKGKWEGREMTWNETGGKGNGKEKGREREERGYSPKLQFLATPLVSY